MIERLFLICLLIINLNLLQKNRTWALLDNQWYNSLTPDQRSFPSAVAVQKSYDSWQPLLKTHKWWITTAGGAAATGSLSMKSNENIERENVSFMLQPSSGGVSAPTQYFTNRLFIYNNQNGNYNKTQITPFSGGADVPNTKSTLSPITHRSRHHHHQKHPLTNIEGINRNVKNNYQPHNPIEQQQEQQQQQQQVNRTYSSHISPKYTQQTNIVDAKQAQRLRHMPDSTTNRQYVTTDVQRHFGDKFVSVPALALIDNRLSHILTTKDPHISTNGNHLEAISDPSPFPANKEVNVDADNDTDGIGKILVHAALGKVKQFGDILKDIMAKEDKNTDEGNQNEGGHANEDVFVQNPPDVDTEGEDVEASLRYSDENDGNDDDQALLQLTPAVLPSARVIKTTGTLKTSPLNLVTKKEINNEGQGQIDNINDAVEKSLTPATESPTSRSLKVLQTTAWGETTQHDVGTNRKIKKKIKKKFKKVLLPLLLAYKLKFLTLIPILIGGLILLVGSTGMAGFFFALFAAVMTMRGGDKYHRSI